MATSDWDIPGSSVEIYQRIFAPAILAEWVPRVRGLADPAPGSHVIDVACGTGVLTRSIAEAVGPSGFVAGVDISSDMLSVARQLSDGRLPAIEWRECDAHGLPFSDDSFDVAYCQLGLMFMADRIKALREMWRVLKPSGRLGVMVWGPIDRCPGHAAMARTWEKVFGPEMSAGFHRMHSLGDPALVGAELGSAGFEEVNVELVSGAARFPSIEHWTRSYGALAGISADEQQQAATIQENTLAMVEFEGAEGFVYPIEAVLGSGRRG